MTDPRVERARRWIPLHRENRYQKLATQIMTDLLAAYDELEAVPGPGFDEWLAEHDREVAACALREVAEDAYDWDQNPDPDGVGGNDWFPSDWAGQVQGWLHHRADLLKGDSGEWVERGEDV